MNDGKRLLSRTAQLKTLLDRLLLPPGPTDSRLRAAGLRAFQVAYAVIRDLAQGELSMRAMSLVYYTVIAFIPLLALTFSVLKGLGAHNAMEPALLNLLAPLGERSEEVTRNIITFVSNVRVDVLGFVSLGVLLYTVLTMMQKIETAFNFIWCVSEGRKLATRVSDYLFALIVSPLLIFVSVGISSSINTNFFARYLESLSFGGSLLQLTGNLFAFLFMSLAFAFAYRFIPNTRVRFGPALIGGFMTTIIWKAMGIFFKSVFANSSSNELIYLAFFTIILVMIFIYLGWLVLLTGSSIAYYLQNPARVRLGRRRPRLSLAEQEASILSVAGLVIERFQKQQRPLNATELAERLRLNPIIIDDILDILTGIGFLVRTDQDPPGFLPAGSVDDARIDALWRQIRHYAPQNILPGEHLRSTASVKAYLDQLEEHSTQHLGDMHFIPAPQQRDQDGQGSSE